MKKPAHRRLDLLLGAAVLCVAAVVMFVIALRGGVQPAQTQATTQPLQHTNENPFAPPEPTQTELPLPPLPDATDAQGQIIIGYTGVTVYHVVPTTTQATAAPTTQPPAQQTQPPTQAQSSMVNLNTANSAQLQTVPGIGPARAQAILDWRAQNGPFTRPEQLLEIHGIGTVTLMNMLPFLYI